MRDALAAQWVGLLVVLPVLAFLGAWIWMRREWNTRTVPSNAVWLATPAAFAWLVDPTLGVLATQGVAWWGFRGWVSEGARGGLVWPLVAMGLWIGLSAPAWVISAGLAGCLAMGMAQAGVALCQWRRVPIFLTRDGMCHGTIGHRTGLGIYLACLVPLAFLIPSPWVWGLLGLFGAGLWVSRSAIAALGAGVGFLWVRPDLWWVGAGFIGVAGLQRFFKLRFEGRKDRRRRVVRLRHVVDSIESRKRIWWQTVWRLASWPMWLVGYGPVSWYGRRWTTTGKVGEVYDECHNDYLQFAYEHGLVGVMAVAWLLWRAADGFRWGDPVTGSALAFAVAMTVNFPVQTAPVMALGGLIGLSILRVAWGV